MENIFVAERNLFCEGMFEGQVYYEQSYCREIPPYSQYVGSHFEILGRRNDQETNFEFQNNANLHSSENSFSGGSGAESPDTNEYQDFPDELLEFADIAEPTCQENIKSSGDVISFEGGNTEIQDNNDSDTGTAHGTWTKPHRDCNNTGGHAQVQIEPMKRIRRLRANDRERRRMRSLNRALESLKKCIPVPKSKRRVTKLEILRIACNYIRSLSDTLKGENAPAGAALRKRSRGDAVVNGFSIAQRLEILSSSTPRI